MLNLIKVHCNAIVFFQIVVIHIYFDIYYAYKIQHEFKKYHFYEIIKLNQYNLVSKQ